MQLGPAKSPRSKAFLQPFHEIVTALHSYASKFRGPLAGEFGARLHKAVEGAVNKDLEQVAAKAGEAADAPRLKYPHEPPARTTTDDSSPAISGMDFKVVRASTDDVSGAHVALLSAAAALQKSAGSAGRGCGAAATGGGGGTGKKRTQVQALSARDGSGGRSDAPRLGQPVSKRIALLQQAKVPSGTCVF